MSWNPITHQDPSVDGPRKGLRPFHHPLSPDVVHISDFTLSNTQFTSQQTRRRLGGHSKAYFWDRGWRREQRVIDGMIDGKGHPGSGPRSPGIDMEWERKTINWAPSQWSFSKPSRDRLNTNATQHRLNEVFRNRLEIDSTQTQLSTVSTKFFEAVSRPTQHHLRVQCQMTFHYRDFNHSYFVIIYTQTVVNALFEKPPIMTEMKLENLKLETHRSWPGRRGGPSKAYFAYRWRGEQTIVTGIEGTGYPGSGPRGSGIDMEWERETIGGWGGFTHFTCVWLHFTSRLLF